MKQSELAKITEDSEGHLSSQPTSGKLEMEKKESGDNRAQRGSPQRKEKSPPHRRVSHNTPKNQRLYDERRYEAREENTKRAHETMNTERNTFDIDESIGEML